MALHPKFPKVPYLVEPWAIAQQTEVPPDREGEEDPEEGVIMAR